MKKLITLVFAALMMSSFAAAQAGNTANGTLAVTANVASSISLVFSTSTGGVALGGSASAATLAFGTVQAFGGTLATGVSRTITANNFTVSSPVDIIVTKANSTSANYTLKANLATADAVNTWTVGGVPVTGGAAAPVTTTGAYGTTSFPVAITVLLTSPAGSITNTINYTATSN
jgi:hypothetical protein